ncbi:MAG: DUF1501 domain-containing protein, partial [Planctomycetes bacterium]|nr:DUF1501 domain-containing protein [Planctomycetota bacterium]
MASGLNRRDAMKLAVSGVAASSFSGWLPVLANAETRLTSKAKSCIVLWMDGGPSHKDTFDLKPDSQGAGEFKPISTSATGVAISEHLPKLAKQMHRIALLRGMSTLEGAHPRAKYMLHTGYREGQGGIQYPALGSIVSSEVGRPEFPIPSFVSIGNRSYTSAYLGPRHQPLVVTDPSRGVENLKSALGGSQFDARVGLLENMEAGFRREYPIGAGLDHQVNYQRAVTMMKSREAAAFDLSKEPEN